MPSFGDIGMSNGVFPMQDCLAWASLPLVTDFRGLGLGSMSGGNLAWEAMKKPLISWDMLQYEHVECVLIFDGLWHSYLGGSLLY